MKSIHKAEREDWILKYMRQPSNRFVDVLNEPFHDAYHEAFPSYKRDLKSFGAQPVQQAMRDLSRMASCGILESSRVGVKGGEGFPTSIICYSLPVERR